MMAIVPRTQVADDLPIPQDRLIVVEHRLGVAPPELHHAMAQSLFALALHRRATDEIGFALGHSKAKPRFQHMILAGDVMTEMAKALFDPAAIHHMHPAKFQVMRLSG